MKKKMETGIIKRMEWNEMRSMEERKKEEDCYVEGTVNTVGRI